MPPGVQQATPTAFCPKRYAMGNGFCFSPLDDFPAAVNHHFDYQKQISHNPVP
jgi:hypothetical protein